MWIETYIKINFHILTRKCSNMYVMLVILITYILAQGHDPLFVSNIRMKNKQKIPKIINLEICKIK